MVSRREVARAGERENPKKPAFYASADPADITRSAERSPHRLGFSGRARNPKRGLDDLESTRTERMMERFWDLLNSLFKFARGVISLFILLFVGIVLWSLYTASHAVQEHRDKPANMPPTPPLAMSAGPASSRPAPPKAAAPLVAASDSVPANPTKGPSVPSAQSGTSATPSAGIQTAPRDPKNPESKPKEERPISLSVTRIGRGSNQFVGSNYISLTAILKNEGTKTIKATKGAIVVFDVFGDQLARFHVENAKTIKPGQTVKESGEWNVMFNPKAQNAVNGEGADKSKLTFYFAPQLILFEDGTRLEE